MQAAATDEKTQTVANCVESMARLRTFLLALANQSPPENHRVNSKRSRLESSMETAGEAVLKQPAPRSACRSEYNKAVGVGLHESAVASPSFSLRSCTSAVPGRDICVQDDELDLERRLQQVKARCYNRRQRRKLQESAY
jgi:hypothetical protein